ncbi:class I SAM-dependent methyltransferase [Sphingobacterium hungaricum]|uniref:Class I SAM-dependent methyltransferase n=1 Tax=Sphingobacterium hungaricum TaxID=2082723 RepID=A0A928UVC5_9SPHI|nr:class I SAM-dependent methyltransferase [Sphingobacterium hungaricum]MBE8714031.1 class I SAM-dependent methyltransferase [Sphingobacterium hungaricum]
MKIDSNFNQVSYNLHESWYGKQFPSDDEKLRKIISIKNYGGSINAWLQNIFFDCLNPILSSTEQQRWLTLGDAYGADANYILQKTSHDVVATDLNTDILAIAQQEELIKEYRAENAEKLSFSDNEFDYVLCKESYHHFPRPYAALYEMIRVAKKAIVIIEPQDPILKMPLLLALSNFLSLFNVNLINKIWKNRFSYEPVGNFVYKASEREFEKFTAGMALPMLAIKKLNPNFYFPNSENEKADNSNKKFRIIRLKKNILDFGCRLGLFPSQTLSAIVFKEIPSEEVVNALKKNRYSIIEIPKNPYA